MQVLAVDVGGTHVKILATGQTERRKFPSGPTLTANQMASGVKKLARGWDYEVASIGYPGPVLQCRPVAEPHNLGRGWVGFDFQKAFGCPVKVINDAAMQALGSYEGGELLFLGLGTGFGSAMVVEGIVEPMELGHLPYKEATYEEYVGLRGLEKHGKKKWRRDVGGRGGSLDCRPRTRRRSSAGRQRQGIRRAAPGLPAGRQCQCLPRRVPPVGAGRSGSSACRKGPF